MRVGIVGSRRRNTLHDRKIVFDIVKLLQKKHGDQLVIVSGACPKGADAFAAEACKVMGVSLKEFPVPNQRYRDKYEYAQAAYARNKLIAEDSDYIVALVADDRKGGTENTVQYAKDMHKVCRIINSEGRVSEER